MLSWPSQRQFEILNGTTVKSPCSKMAVGFDKDYNINYPSFWECILKCIHCWEEGHPSPILLLGLGGLGGLGLWGHWWPQFFLKQRSRHGTAFTILAMSLFVCCLCLLHLFVRLFLCLFLCSFFVYLNALNFCNTDLSRKDQYARAGQGRMLRADNRSGWVGILGWVNGIYLFCHKVFNIAIQFTFS